MNGYNVHEVLYLDLEIHDSWVRGSGSRAGQIWPNSENILHFIISSVFHNRGDKLQ